MIVVDASIAIRIMSREPGAEAAYDRIVGDEDRLAPDWIRIEVLNALANKVRGGRLSSLIAREAAKTLPLYVPDMVDSIALLDNAFTLSAQIDHAMYDCLYLEAALRTNAIVVTADADFVKAARRGGFGDHVELLA